MSRPQLIVLWCAILIVVVEVPLPDSKAAVVERERTLVAFRLLRILQLEVACLGGLVTPSRRRICCDVSHTDILGDGRWLLTGALSRPLGPRGVLLKLP